MGLQGANKSAHWDGWEIENPIELYCTHELVPIARVKERPLLEREVAGS